MRISNQPALSIDASQPSRVERVKAVLRIVSLALLWLVLAMTLLDYGAVNPESRIILCFSLYALLFVVCLVFGIPEHARRVVMVAFGLLVATLFIVALQTTPNLLPANAAWSTVRLFTGSVEHMPASLTPADDWLATLSVAFPIAFFVCALVLLDTDERALLACRWLAIAGGIVAVISIIQFLVFPDTLGFGPKRYYRESLTGFFVNRNTAATFFGLIVLLLFVQVFRALEALGFSFVREYISSSAFASAEQKKRFRMMVIELALLMAAFIALMMTLSRGGVLASVVALVLLLWRLLSQSRLLPKGPIVSNLLQYRKRTFQILAAAVIVLGVVIAFSGGVLFRVNVGDASRFCLLPGIIDTIRAGAPWGSGLASFAYAYAPFADPECGVNAVLIMAHNVYLEGLATLGLFFIPLLVVFFFTLVKTFLRGIRTRKRYRFAGELGLAALLLVAIHSLVDFSVQIPGFAISFAALLAPVTTLCLRPSALERITQGDVSAADRGEDSGTV